MEKESPNKEKRAKKERRKTGKGQVVEVEERKVIGRKRQNEGRRVTLKRKEGVKGGSRNNKKERERNKQGYKLEG